MHSIYLDRCWYLSDDYEEFYIHTVDKNKSVKNIYLFDLQNRIKLTRATQVS